GHAIRHSGALAQRPSCYTRDPLRARACAAASSTWRWEGTMAGRTKRKPSPAPRMATARPIKRAAVRGPRMTAVPATMKAAVVDRFGPPDVLMLRTVPTPQVSPGEVLIALHAAGIGIWDAQIREGTWAEGDEHFPLILGSDGAGTIAALGARVRGFDLGQ